MKKSIKVTISMFLAFLIMIQSMAITVFAVDEELAKTPGETTDASEITNDIADMPNIVCEVESKRDACKKDYLLEDGSFCSIITSNPIHEYSNGKWIEKVHFNDSKSIESILSIVQTTNDETCNYRRSLNRAENTLDESNGLIIDWGNTTLETVNGTNWHNLQTASIFYLKPSSVGEYISNNYLVTSAFLSIYCRLLLGSGTTSRLYPVTSWNPGSSLYNNQKLLSDRSITTDGLFSYNITDLFNRWDKGVEDNLGIAFSAANKKRLSVSNPSIVVRYLDVDSADLDFTYHSQLLNNAGTLYLNDVTNTFKLKQKLLNYNYNETDLSIYRTYDSADAGINNFSGIKSTFNFESVLSVNTDYAEWTMFDGNPVRFIPSDPLVSSNGYEVWDLLQSSNSANLNALLYLPATENSSLAPYTLINGLKYLFDAGGRIDRIVSVPSNENIMSFTYNVSLIDILLQDGNKYRIEKSAPSDSFVSAVKLLDASNQPVTDENNAEKKTLFSYVNNNNQIINTVTFYNGDTSVYTFDAEGHLLNASSTTNSNTIRCEFEYAEYSNQVSGNHITGYEVFNGNSNIAFESLTIDSNNTFKRVFTDISGKEEVIYYNSDYRIVTYIGADGKYKYLDYDENGLLNSYIFKSSGSEMVLENDFPELDLEPWISLDDDDYEFAVQADNPDGNGKTAKLGDKDEILSVSLYQDIVQYEEGPQIIFEADKTYVFGGKLYLNNALPDLDREITITVETAPVVNGIPSSDYTVYSTIVFDNTLLLDWQYRLKAFKLEEDSVIRISLNTIEQNKYSYFTDITLFESKDAGTDLDDLITSSPIEYTYSNGKVTSETMTWERLNDSDLTMNTAYSYSQDGKLRSHEDYNGNLTYYQYDSNGKISGKGHSIDGQNNITDVNSLAYDAENALISTSQIIKNVETNSNVTLSTAYEEESETENGVTVKCVRITHNGYDQVYKYNTDGMLLETYAESSSLPSDFTNYNTAYQYDANSDIVQIEYSNGSKDVFYEIDEEDDYTYKAISCYKVNGQTETLIKTYYYQFDESGELLNSYDDSTSIMVDYSNNGYSLYDCSTSEDTLIFSKESSNGDDVQTYSNTNFSLPDSGITPTYTDPDTIETTPSSITVDNDGVKTSVSSVTVEKNQGNHIMTAEYERTSVEDYFGRLISKETTLDHEMTDTLSGGMSLSEEYEYKDLGNGRTSGLVSGFVSTLSGSYEHPDENNNNTPTVSNFSDTYARHYEYDNRGNLIFVYAEEGNSIVEKEYYEYDDANQVITEYNSESRIIAHYTYNAGGNLTAKIYYDFSSSVFDPLSRSITTLGNEIDRITYQYDSVWKDRLINYDGVTITYDKMGNPLNYVGTNIEGASIIGTLEWHGNLLSAFESNDKRIEYQYDRNGFRIFKAVYDKRVENNNVIYSNVYAIDYLWDNGVLIGIIYSDLNDSTGVREELFNVNFIYDEEGSVSGYVSYVGIPYLFKKDIHDNVLSLVFPDGDDLFTYSYDSWGNATATYSNHWSSDPVSYIIVRIMAMLCPMAYHGYLYDYETGMCFNKGRCYSPDWGRNLNPEDYEKLIERPENPLEANLYLFCNNNPLNILDKTASWHREYTGVEWKANGFEVAMSDMFVSRPLCTLFASQVIKEHGTWDVTKGYNYMGLNAEDIACDLFAHCVGKYAKAAINKVNAVWGDGWILNNSKSDRIFIYKEDPNLNNPNNPNEYGKYYKIWIAAPEIKAYAQKEGIFITL